MAVSASLPQWATDIRTFRRIGLFSGVALGLFLALVAAVAPQIPHAIVNVIFIPIGLVALFVAVPIIALRVLVVRQDEHKNVAPTRLLVAYVLSAIPLGVACLLLGALAAFAFIVHSAMGPALVASAVALFVIWVLLSLTVKICANAQLLLAHWAKR